MHLLPIMLTLQTKDLEAKGEIQNAFARRQTGAYDKMSGVYVLVQALHTAEPQPHQLGWIKTSK